ncbi:MAG: aldehyde dehydrogenase family protein, partial [Candidatus Binatia bacterium]
MKEQLQFYIDGRWVEPLGKKMIDVVNPATEEVIGRVSLGSAEDVGRAVAAARKAFPSYSRTTKEERLALIQNIMACYQERVGELAET